MRRGSNKAFALVLVLVAITLVGAAVVVLSRAGQDMRLQSDQEYAQAQARNLAASALAWAGANPHRLSAAGKNGVRLTVDGDRDTSVELATAKATDSGIEVKVTVHCRSGKCRINHTQTYDLPSH
jgi:hypothetical protein